MMNKWDEAKRLIGNKLCSAARKGQPCQHTGCAEAQSALGDLNAGMFTDLVHSVLTNKLCRSARQGNDCGHAACAEIRSTIDALAGPPATEIVESEWGWCDAAVFAHPRFHKGSLLIDAASA